VSEPKSCRSLGFPVFDSRSRVGRREKPVGQALAGPAIDMLWRYVEVFPWWGGSSCYWASIWNESIWNTMSGLVVSSRDCVLELELRVDDGGSWSG
jgi:hypothetical protein